MKKQFETRLTRVTLVPENEGLWSGMRTDIEVAIVDGDEVVCICQPFTEQRVVVTGQMWPDLQKQIEQAFLRVRGQ